MPVAPRPSRNTLQWQAFLWWSTPTVLLGWTSRATAATLPTANDFLVSGLEEVEPAFASFEGSMYAGLLPIDRLFSVTGGNTSADEGGDGEYMFWLFQPDGPQVDDALVIWFNGGPGCSSFHAGLLMEHGPVTTQLHPAGYTAPPQEKDAPLQPNQEFAWTRVATMLYVEQPVPVGFSHGGTVPHNETDVGRAFDVFVQNFMTVFQQHQGHKRVFLVGESYAGMYIPSIGHFVYQQNVQQQKQQNNRRRNKDDDAERQEEGPPRRIPIHLAGIALGNGWVDVQIQGPLVIDYAWFHGLIDSVTRDALHGEWEHCKRRISFSNSNKETSPDSSEQESSTVEPSPFHPFTVPDECGIMGAVLQAAGAGVLPSLSSLSPNTYDVTTWDPYDLLRDDNNNTHTRFFNNPRVQQLLHVHDNNNEEEPRLWMGCLPGAGRRRLQQNDPPRDSHDSRLLLRRQRNLLLLDDDRPLSTAPYIAELLDRAHIPVLVYNGDRDMSTCAQGSEMVLDKMNWSGQANWSNPDAYRRGLWLVQDGKDDEEASPTTMAGYAKEVKNLTFVVVYNSGHLVPYNRPRVALDLIRRVVAPLGRQSFVDKVIPVVYKAPRRPKPKTGWSGEANLQETIILIVIAFTFGYATSIALSRFHVKYFGVEESPHHHHHRGSDHERMPLLHSTSRTGDHHHERASSRGKARRSGRGSMAVRPSERRLLAA